MTELPETPPHLKKARSSFTMDPILYAKFQEFCKSKQISASELISKAVEKYLSEY